MKNGYYVTHRPWVKIKGFEWYMEVYEDGVLKGAAQCETRDQLLKIYKKCVERKEVKCNDLYAEG